MLKFLYQLSKHRCVGNVMKFLSPFLKGFLQLYPVMDIMRRLSSGMIYPLNYVFKHIVLSIVLFSPIITFSFPLFCLTFLVIWLNWAVRIPCLGKHLIIQLCQQDPVTIVDDIPVTTDGWELFLLVCLIQQAGKWFSSSLALGTDVVADI